MATIFLATAMYINTLVAVIMMIMGDYQAGSAHSLLAIICMLVQMDSKK